MARTTSLKPRARQAPNRIASATRYGLGRKRYEPGRDSRRHRVFKRDLFRCRMHWESKAELVPLQLHSSDKHAVGYVDHWIPLDQGGPDTENNQWLLCKSCHDQKTAEDQRTIREPRDFGAYIISNIT